ncbi:nitrate reductase [Sulfuriflexus mobilis]|uniref:nitrate reductase n=1 Tax=Sulfuriflexus mobilis TaxID=1811807 RepID=UPI000F843AC3|nr:nitrate reductase [Sulfuriflexus mobilis]
MSDNKANQQGPLTRTTCPYCGVGCGVLAQMNDRGIVTVKGDETHPANFGRLCSKGTALSETVYLDERLLYPEILDEQVSWEQALSTVAGRFQEIIAEHGPDAVAFYVSGQLLTEDYYVANKLMKGFIGSANIDTNSRLCMSSVVAANKRAFGEDVVPGCYDDLERAKLIVLTGSNTAWCHPVIYQRIVRAKKDNPDLLVVNIDPRQTQTSSIADLHLALRPGTDSILFNGLLAWLDSAGEHNALFTSHFTNGLEAAMKMAKDTAPSIEVVAEKCDLAVDEVKKFYRLFARTERSVTVFSQGINQSSSGVDKVNSIINCHLFTGRIGRPGMGPFSLTGQPNAMGGREVGGLANQLAAHMELTNEGDRERVKRFWQSPQIADKEGHKAIDLFNAIHVGKVKAVWIIATNPVVSLPEADKVKAALEKCELVVVSDCVRKTDTAQLAHIRLPATTWGERDGTVTNSERCISRQRSFLQAPGMAKPDWWIITEVAKRMGFAEAFPYTRSADIFREHARLSGFENDHSRLFDISGLADITNQQYDALAPIQWPITKQDPQGRARLYTDGRFNTADKKACFIAVEPRPPATVPTDEYPFVLNTGRVRDHWHTMTRTGMSPRLSAHTIESYVEIHPDDARSHAIDDAELVELVSPLATSIYVRARLSDKQQRGSLFVPIHWNQQFSSQAAVGSLIRAVLDPISGQPEFKHSVVRIKPCKARWYGFIIARRKPALKYAKYWARSRGKGFWRYELAGEDLPEDWSEHAHALLNQPGEDESWVEFYDKAKNHYRAARIINDRLDSCIFIFSSHVLPPRDWLISLFQKDTISSEERANLLRGEAPHEQADTGRIVCACFNVGEKTLRKTIDEKGLRSVEEIGEQLRAGTNCGSCKPELAELLK